MRSIISRYFSNDTYRDDNDVGYLGVRFRRRYAEVFSYPSQGVRGESPTEGQTFEMMSEDWFGSSLMWWVIADQNYLRFPEGESESGDSIYIPVKGASHIS